MPPWKVSPASRSITAPPSASRAFLRFFTKPPRRGSPPRPCSSTNTRPWTSVVPTIESVITSGSEAIAWTAVQAARTAAGTPAIQTYPLTCQRDPDHLGIAVDPAAGRDPFASGNSLGGRMAFWHYRRRAPDHWGLTLHG